MVLRKAFWQILLLLLAMVLLSGYRSKPNFTPVKEARGVWLSRWEYAGNAGLKSPKVMQAKISKVMKNARLAKLNFVLFQVRGQCDAFYRSSYEPWAQELTGALGKHPGWDPLAFAIEEAHKNGLELHAWVNAFTCWNGTNPPAHSYPRHLYHAHPEWLCANATGKRMQLNSGYVYLSPGIPEVQSHVFRVTMEIVRQYNVDGIHFDYIRYPERSDLAGYSHDKISKQRFYSRSGNPHQLNWKRWQQAQINDFVARFYDAATAVKPALKISAAVLGRIDGVDGNSPATVFQDAQQWLNAGKMDFILPMLYWQRNNPVAPFEKLARQWLRQNRTNRYVFPGLGIYRYNNYNWPYDEIPQQIRLTREFGAKGLVFFSYAALREMQLSNRLPRFTQPANFPPMTWKDPIKPMAPQRPRVRQRATGTVLLEWHSPARALDGELPARYNIYRGESRQALNLVAITENNELSYFDMNIESGKVYYYAVTALDKCQNESELSEIVAMRVSGLLAMNAGK